MILREDYNADGVMLSQIEYEDGRPIRITEPDLKTVTTIEYGAETHRPGQ